MRRSLPSNNENLHSMSLLKSLFWSWCWSSLLTCFFALFCRFVNLLRNQHWRCNWVISTDKHLHCQYLKLTTRHQSNLPFSKHTVFITLMCIVVSISMPTNRYMILSHIISRSLNLFFFQMKLLQSKKFHLPSLDFANIF